MELTDASIADLSLVAIVSLQVGSLKLLLEKDELKSLIRVLPDAKSTS